jgi:uncharacterized membrane protein YdbT with pleckstrin-like domain
MSAEQPPPPLSRWLVGGVAITVMVAAVAALVVFGLLYGLIVLVAGAVLATGAAVVWGALRS